MELYGSSDYLLTLCDIWTKLVIREMSFWTKCELSFPTHAIQVDQGLSEEKQLAQKKREEIET